MLELAAVDCTCVAFCHALQLKAFKKFVWEVDRHRRLLYFSFGNVSGCSLQAGAAGCVCCDSGVIAFHVMRVAVLGAIIILLLGIGGGKDDGGSSVSKLW